MSVRTILVPIFGSDVDIQCLSAAADLAARVPSHITALYCDPDPGPGHAGEGWESSLFFSEALVKTIERSAQQRKEWAERNYSRWQQEATPRTVTPNGPRMPRSELIVEPGDPKSAIQSHAVVADLVVASLAGPDPTIRSMLLSTLFDLRRPVLAVPAAAAKTIFTPPVAIAWNYSAQAARALQAAMPLVEAVGEAVVLQAGHHEDEGAARRIGTYLARHGVRAEIQKLGRVGSAAGLIAARVAALGSGLLVMGAYSHTRAREFVFGGVTRYMLERAPVPLLLAR